MKGVNPDLADALVRGEIRSVKALANADLEHLVAALERARTAGQLQTAPTVYQLAKIQQVAAKLDGFGMLVGRLLHRNGQPVRNALVDIGDQDTHTAANGWYAFDKVAVGRVQTRIVIEDHPVALDVRAAEIKSGKLTGPVVRHLAPVPDTPFSLPVIREMDGHLIANTRGTRVELVWRPLAEFADGMLLQVRNLGQDRTSRLLSLYKEQIGNVIRIPRARVKIADLPAGAREGDILRCTNGGLEATTLTPADVAALKRRTWQESTTTRTRRVIRIS